MRSTRSLLHALGRRFEAVIAGEPDPQLAMDEIALEAERRGLVDIGSSLRRDSPLAFVMDLWYGNPLVLDLLNLRRETLPDPRHVNDLSSVLDAIP